MSIQPDRLSELADSVKTVYITLLKHSSDDRFCRISLKKLVEHSGYGKTAVVNGVKLLEARQIIKVHRSVLPPPNGQTINEYEIVWFSDSEDFDR